MLQEFIHGPHRYPGGGDKSHQALDVLAALKCQFPRRVHFLPGNHELAQQTGQWIAKAEDDLNEQFRLGRPDGVRRRADRVYAAYLELFAAAPWPCARRTACSSATACPSASKLATFNPAVLEQEQSTRPELRPGGSVHALVWGRDVSRRERPGLSRRRWTPTC